MDDYVTKTLISGIDTHFDYNPSWDNDSFCGQKIGKIEPLEESVNKGWASLIPKYHPVSQELLYHENEALIRGLAQAEERAIIDPLTGLFNQGAFQQTLLNYEKKIEKAPIVDGKRLVRDYMSLLLIDLDNFKEINDNHGHPMGDFVLSSVGKYFNSKFRINSQGYRPGGDEFAMVVYGTLTDGVNTGHRILTGFDGFFKNEIDDKISVLNKKLESIDKNDIKRNVLYKELLGYEKIYEHLITFSIGVSHFDETTSNVAELNTRADEALYHAKHAGRNRLVVDGQYAK